MFNKPLVDFQGSLLLSFGETLVWDCELLSHVLLVQFVDVDDFPDVIEVIDHLLPLVGFDLPGGYGHVTIEKMSVR